MTSDNIYKPNSVANSKTSKRSPSVTFKSQSPSSAPATRERTMDTFPENTALYRIHQKPQTPSPNKLVMDKDKRAAILSKKHYVEEEWNFSPQCSLLGHYQEDLKDCYPRDPTTKLPHRHASPKYLAMHKNVPISAFSDAEAYKKERRVMYQPETILDAQTKVKYNEDSLQNRPQVFLNICNDLNSQMFQREL